MPILRRPFSLAMRLTLLFGIVASISFPLFGWILSQDTKNHFVEEDISELEFIANAAEGVLASIHTEDDIPQMKQRFDDFLVGHHHASLYIADKNKKMVYASPGPDLSSIVREVDPVVQDDMIFDWTNQNHTYTTMIQYVDKVDPAANGPYTLVISEPIDIHLRFLAAFQRSLWIMVICSIFVMGLMGWIVARQGHAPLRDIVARIRRISASELNIRLSPENMPAELTDLAISFNEMIERVNRAFHRLSDFNADIAHELRTPITNLMTQTQVALSRARSIDEYREILYSNMEEYERMAQMVGDMLFLAQTDNHPQIKDIETVNLAEEVQALFEYYEGWAEERGVGLVIYGTATVTGNRSMLRRAISNLLSNAIRHTKTSGKVRVNIASTDKMATLTVENPGPDIPAEHLPKLFDRFYRVDPARQRNEDGAGLGLAIVKSIVTAHGGQVQASSADGVTRFSITFPMQSPKA